jgi:hypothetical protein
MTFFVAKVSLSYFSPASSVAVPLSSAGSLSTQTLPRPPQNEQRTVPQSRGPRPAARRQMSQLRPPLRVQFFLPLQWLQSSSVFAI